MSSSLFHQHAVISLINLRGQLDVSRTSTEDLLPSALYKEAVESYIRHWHPAIFKEKSKRICDRLNHADFGKDGVVTATEAIFKQDVFAGGSSFDKLGVLQEAMVLLDEKRKDPKNDGLVSEVRNRILGLCQLLKRKIAESERAEKQRSGKQNLRRIISDFMAIHRNSCAVFDLQLFLERMQREARSVGQDATMLESRLNSMLEKVGKLRAAKQDRLVDKDWRRWADWIELIRKDPLNPGDSTDVVSSSASSNLQPQVVPVPAPTTPA